MQSFPIYSPPPQADHIVLQYLSIVWPVLDRFKLHALGVKLTDALRKAEIGTYLNVSPYPAANPAVTGDSIPARVLEIIITHMRLGVSHTPEAVVVMGYCNGCFSQTVDPTSTDSRALRAALVTAVRQCATYELNQATSRGRYFPNVPL